MSDPDMALHPRTYTSLLMRALEEQRQVGPQPISPRRAAAMARRAYWATPTGQMTTRERWNAMPQAMRSSWVRALGSAVLALGCVIAGPVFFSGWIAFGIAMIAWPLLMNSGFNAIMLRSEAGTAPEDQQRAARLLSELAHEMGMRTPKLTVLNTKKMVNAAAMQIFRRQVLITVPLLHKMDDFQVKGVLAHELYHLRHHDSHRGLAAYWGMNAAFQGASAIKSQIFSLAGHGVAMVSGYLIGPIAMTAMLVNGYWRERQADVSAARRTPYGEGLKQALAILAPNQLQRPASRLQRVKVRAQAVYSIAPHPPVWDRLDTIDKAMAKRERDLARRTPAAPVRGIVALHS